MSVACGVWRVAELYLVACGPDRQQATVLLQATGNRLISSQGCYDA